MFRRILSPQRRRGRREERKESSVISPRPLRLCGDIALKCPLIRRRRGLILLGWALLITAMAYGMAPRPSLTRFEFAQGHMGTRFKITLYASDAQAANRAAQAAFERIAQLDHIMSDYLETSELMRLCRQPRGQPVPVSEDLFRILSEAQKFAERTQGAFDVTVGPIVQLWRRARRTGELPDPERLAQALERTGYTKMHLDKKTHSVRLDQPGMRLDLGGIAKGYAAEEAIFVLKRHGIRRALVAAGGDIMTSGPPPGTRGWTVGIAPLESPNQPPTQPLLLQHAAVSTSGDAEQHVEIGGVRYSHIVDPRTGQSLTGRNSVTVVAPHGTTAEALTKAISVLGPVRGFELVDATPGAAALVSQLTEHGLRTVASKRWKNLPKPKDGT